MKKFFVSGCLVVGFCSIVFSATGPGVKVGGDVNIAASSNSVMSVSSSTVTTDPAVYFGVQRIYANTGASTVYRSVSSTAAYSVGIPLYKNERWIEDRWFGIIYWQAETGASAVDVRREYIRE